MKSTVSIKTKILIVEHDLSDLHLLQYELKNSGVNWVSEIVQNEDAYRNALENFVPDIILSDYSLPSFDGPEAFKIRQQMAPDTPFIFVSGNIGEENSIEYIRNGVTDYVLKDKLFTLNTKVERALKESKEKQQKNKTEKELIQSERLLVRAHQIAHMGSWEIDLSTNINTWSDEFYNIFGLKRDDIQPSTEAFLSLLHPEDINVAREKVKKHFKTFTDSFFYARINTTDGSIRYGYTEWRFEFDNNNNATYVYGICQDITEMKEAEKKIIKANRLYSFISQINKTICRVKDEQTLYKEVCRIAIEQGKFTIGLIAKIDVEDKKINLEQQCGLLPENISRFINVPYKKDGPIDSVLRTGDYNVCNNVELDFKLTEWKRFASVNQILSFIILPVKKEGVITATFNLYSSETNFFDTEEIKMLQEAAEDISFGLGIFEKEKRQRDTEELVVQSENRFRVMIEKSTDMKTLSTQDGEMIYGSPSITKVLGYSLKEFLHTFAFNLIHPDDMPGFIKKRKAILETPGKSFYNQNRFLHKNGSWIWCEGIITNMLHEPGIHALVSNYRDISEKKIAEQQREFDRNNLTALINCTTDLMWSVDLDFRLITFNQPFYEIIRLTSGKELSKGDDVFSVVLSPEQSDRFKISYARAFTGESFTEIEYIPIPVEFWSEISYYPIRKGDEVIGTACHSHNITERKLAELERTKITNDLMRHNKDLEQFAYIVSHNLRAPVANILGATRGLNYPGLKAEKKVMLTRGLGESATGLDNIIKDLSHILQVKRTINEVKEKVLFSKLVDAIKISIKDLIDGASIEIKYDFSEINELVSLKSYLYNIFYNLISNSIKYCQQQVPCIVEIKSYREKHKLELIFTDNGMGIDLQKRGDQVFGLYKRFHANIEGKGMGLFMVKAQVETLGGKISVRSEVNKGTQFKIEFEV